VIDLRLGDCLEILPTLQGVDAVVSDPPYGMGKYNKFGSRGNLTDAQPYTPIVGDDKPFDPTPFLDFPKVILFGANWYHNRLPNWAGWIIWDKRDGMTSNNFGDCEMAWVKDAVATRIFRHRWNGMIKASEQNQKRVHPTQKPIALMRWIIENYTDEGDTIFDPYMGSGTTGIAAVQLGRNFIGCEIVPEYFAIAQKRIEAAQSQMVMPL
jgi:site-specific DNA-methyltransferase (adenine-specific)